MTALGMCVCDHQESSAEILRWESFASERLRILRMTIALATGFGGVALFRFAAQEVPGFAVGREFQVLAVG